VGCAAVGELYTLAIVWRLRLAERYPTLRLLADATDADPEAIARAAEACYPSPALRDLPAELAVRAFTPTPEGLRPLRRIAMPSGYGCRMSVSRHRKAASI
jgi:chemotaxis methyl-accepting protein methylase